MVLKAFAHKEVLDEADVEEEIAVTPQEVPEPQTLDGLSLSATSVPAFADYRGVTFTGPVSLKNVRFQQGFSFEGATFLKPVRLVGVVNDRIRGSSASFAKATFKQTLTARRCALYLADFSEAKFEQLADLKGCRFYASAKFDKADFLVAANLSSVTFNGSGNFREALFRGSCDFERVAFKYRISHARFNEARFSNHVGFNQAQFSGEADFTEAVFSSGVSFDGARFSLGLSQDAVSQDDVESESQEGDGDLPILFEKTTFRADDDGEVASFKEVRFGDRRLRRAVSFRGAIFRPNEFANKPKRCLAAFNEMEIFGPVDFRDVSFSEEINADFSQARFGDDVDLSGCSFAGDAEFEKCHFRSDILLAQTRFGRYPNFRQTAFHHHPELSQSALPSRNSTWPRRERPAIVQRLTVLRRLAAKTDDKKTEFELLVRELKLEGGLASRAYGMVSNYGQSWLRPAVWLLFLSILVFPPLYLANGKLRVADFNGLPIPSLDQIVRCENGSEGHAGVAATELSIRTSLIVGMQDEQRAARIADCLGVGAVTSPRGLVAATLEATQTVMTLVLVFFIGQAVRRRLQMR